MLRIVLCFMPFMIARVTADDSSLPAALPEHPIHFQSRRLNIGAATPKPRQDLINLARWLQFKSKPKPENLPRMAKLIEQLQHLDTPEFGPEVKLSKDQLVMFIQQSLRRTVGPTTRDPNAKVNLLYHEIYNTKGSYSYESSEFDIFDKYTIPRLFKMNWQGTVRTTPEDETIPPTTTKTYWRRRLVHQD